MPPELEPLIESWAADVPLHAQFAQAEAYLVVVREESRAPLGTPGLRAGTPDRHRRDTAGVRSGPVSAAPVRTQHTGDGACTHGRLRRELVLFCLLAYALAWLTWVPLWLGGVVVTKGSLPTHLPGLLAPAVAAVIAAALAGRPTLRGLGRRLTGVRAGLWPGNWR